MNNRYDDRRGGEHRQGQSGRDERGFMDRAGDEVRSWFGDEEAERRREADERRWEREQRMSGNRDNQYGSDRYRSEERSDYAGFATRPEQSWNRERPGSPGASGAYGGGDWTQERSSERMRGGGESWRSRDRDRSEHRYGDFTSAGGGGGGGAEVFGEPGQGGSSGFGGYPDHGRRFDRVDPGHVGTQGAHPMSSPVGGAYGGSYGVTADGGYGSSARYGGPMQEQGLRGRQAGAATGFMSGGREHDPHYAEWRNRQIQSLDRDYDEYRREHQGRFEQEFGSWRSKRNEQRQHLTRVSEHMEVVGSDGQKIGTVDKVRGDRVILTRNDENAGGVHHSFPCSWIDKVEDKVTVNKSREEAMRQWQDEDRNRALFEREDSGSPGPHVLNRSFSGTYGRND